MNSRDVIKHPGRDVDVRMVSAPGDITRHSVQLNAGQNLLEETSKLMGIADCQSGLLILDGAELGPFDYVIPSESNDKLHAAWYSETYSCDAARLRHATAIVGQRDGDCWMHCHALWDTENSAGMGHLLPDTLILANDATVTLFVFSGGTFDVALDEETAFSIFHVHGERCLGNAFIAKINPHEDIYTALEELIVKSGFSRAGIFGIGSLVGAHFEEGKPMECPISEVLISPDASWDGDLKLPVYCVDTENRLFDGTLVKGGAPVLITFEVMVVEFKEF